MKQFTTSFMAYMNVLWPTATGLAVAILVSFMTLLIHLVPHLQRYFNVETNWHVGSVTVVLINDFLLKLFGTSKLDTIVLSIFWMIVGLMVYLFLKAAVSFFVQMSEDISESEHYVQPRSRGRQDNELRELVARSLFRLVVLILTIFYGVWMLTYFLHGIVADGTAFGQWLNSFPAIRDGVLFVAECLAWQLLIVLLRLASLKSRLFG